MKAVDLTGALYGGIFLSTGDHSNRGGVFYDFSSSSLAAFLVLNGALSTKPDGTRTLINSKGDDVTINSGQMLNFDGVAGMIRTSYLPTVSQLQTTCVTVDNLTLGASGFLAGAGYSTTSMNGWVTITYGTTGLVSVGIKTENSAGTFVQYTLSSTTVIANGDRLVATINGNTGEIKLYINGVLDSETIESGLVSKALAPVSTYNYNIGAGGNNTSWRNYANADIGNVQFVAGIMTPKQVLEDYQNPDKSLSRLINSRSSSVYLESIEKKTYDSTNPTHVLITNALGNWTSAVLNDSSKQHFFVEPNAIDYGEVILTQSGTADKPRTISLYNGNNIHPSRLADNEQAKLNIVFRADYWHIDRLSTLDDTSEQMFMLDYGASNNVINRCHFRNYYGGILVKDGANNNTIQLNYFNHMTHAGRLSDNVGVALVTAGQENVLISGTKIISNEIRNAGDGIQLVRSSGVMTGSYPDTIIDSNTIWMDGDTYTNGDYTTNGYNPNGEYMVGENAMDLKIGSDDISKPVVITNNIMYGYRELDPSVGGDTGRGAPFVAHYGTANVIFEDNIIHDSQGSFYIADSNIYSNFSGVNWSIKRNVFANIGFINPEDRAAYACYVYEGKDIKFEDNIFYNFKMDINNAGFAFRYETAEDGIGCTFKRNVLIGVDKTSDWYNHDNPLLNDGVSIVDISDNYFYASTATSAFNSEAAPVNARNYTTIAEANMEALTFDSQILSNTKSNNIIGTLTTNLSPHYGGGEYIESKETNALVFAVPLLDGTGNPTLYHGDGSTTTETANHADINASWALAKGLPNGLQKIAFDENLVYTAEQMNFNSDSTPITVATII